MDPLLPTHRVITLEVMRAISREVVSRKSSNRASIPQRPYAELLYDARGMYVVVDRNRMKIWSVPHGDMGSDTNKVAVPEGAAGSPPF
jgi:hypothetical protein